MNLMKFLIPALMSLFLSSYASADTCNGEIVEWGRCAAQFFPSDQGFPIGFKRIAIDPLNGGEATFVCTEVGWAFETGTCHADQNEESQEILSRK
ncbi:MAG: hypothetical protein ACK5Y2_03365 [Bdellovibrionales bacterium]